MFGVLTVQDRLSGPQPVPYTEFKSQVASKNVQELFPAVTQSKGS
jgi:hypothetical protein